MDSYVSLFGFRPPLTVLEAMHSSLNPVKGGSMQSHVEVPMVGTAMPRPSHIMVMALCSVGNVVSRK
jgi:hypothetical protein